MVFSDQTYQFCPKLCVCGGGGGGGVKRAHVTWRMQDIKAHGAEKKFLPPSIDVGPENPNTNPMPNPNPNPNPILNPNVLINITSS